MAWPIKVWASIATRQRDVPPSGDTVGPALPDDWYRPLKGGDAKRRGGGPDQGRFILQLVGVLDT